MAFYLVYEENCDDLIPVDGSVWRSSPAVSTNGFFI